MVRQFTFPKEEKLTGEITVNTLFQKGESFIAYPIRVVWSSQHDASPALKLLISVPKKKLKHATDRNRVKRLLREAYRLNKSSLLDFVQSNQLKVHLAFVWIPNELSDFAAVERKVSSALLRLQTTMMDKKTNHGEIDQ